MRDSVSKFFKKNWKLIILIIAVFSLRLINIGYSDFQGDEIKALYIIPEGQSITGFFLEQRKGPLQFITTFLLGLLNPGYTNQLIMRLPFALSASISALVFYEIVRIHFNEKTAFLAAFFYATNGFLVALARIVQYQSLVMLFSMLTLYMFTLANKSNKWKISGIYFGFAFWTASILAHYDGIFISPFAAYLLYQWIKKNGKTSINHLIIAFIALFILPLLSFYIPFALNISTNTRNYWLKRLKGSATKISSTNYLFRLYNPIYGLHMYMVLAVLGIMRYYSTHIIPVLQDIRKLKIKKPLVKSIEKLINLLNENQKFFWALWILFPYTLLEIIVDEPGTHIYTYLIPLFIVIAYGVETIEDIIHWILSKKFATFIFTFGVISVFTFIYSQTYWFFVDHSTEYPWQNKDFLVWTVGGRNQLYHSSLFGFPYNRKWEEVGERLKKYEDGTYYSSNENNLISTFYSPMIKDNPKTDYYLYVKNPQSFDKNIRNNFIRAWVDSHNPVDIISDENGRTLVEIYHVDGAFIDVNFED